MTSTGPAPRLLKFPFEMTPLTFHVGDLLGRPGQHRQVVGTLPLQLKVGESSVDGEALVTARLEGVSDGILVTVQAETVAHHQCARCLTEWSDVISIEAVELFTRRSAGDQPAIAADLTIDLSQIVHDEISLNLPPDPLCLPDCAGLCAICGADLNMAPCAGHGDDLASPFAALKQLFET